MSLNACGSAILAKKPLWMDLGDMAE